MLCASASKGRIVLPAIGADRHLHAQCPRLTAVSSDNAQLVLHTFDCAAFSRAGAPGNACTADPDPCCCSGFTGAMLYLQRHSTSDKRPLHVPTDIMFALFHHRLVKADTSQNSSLCTKRMPCRSSQARRTGRMANVQRRALERCFIHHCECKSVYPFDVYVAERARCALGGIRTRPCAPANIYIFKASLSKRVANGMHSKKGRAPLVVTARVAVFPQWTLCTSTAITEAGLAVPAFSKTHRQRAAHLALSRSTRIGPR